MTDMANSPQIRESATGDDKAAPRRTLSRDAVVASMYRDSIKLGATHRGKRYLIPCDWGTEAMTWDSELSALSLRT